MRISPLDIRKQTFKKTMRGADPDEVRIFLELVAAEYEKVLQENAMMAERMRHQEDRLSEYGELEKGLRNALVTADRIASESRSASEREAQRTLQDASIRAERILEGARERLQGLIREIEALRGKREAFLRRFLTLIQSQIGVVAEHAQDPDEVEAMRRQVEALLTECRIGVPDVKEPAQEEDRIADHRGREILDDEIPLADKRAVDERHDRIEQHVRTAPAGLDDELDSAEQPGSRSIPRGLGRLLRGRQARLPLDAEATNEDGERAEDSELSQQDANAFFPLRQRREGFFEISASEEEKRIRQGQE